MAQLIGLWGMVFFWFAIYSIIWWTIYLVQKYEDKIQPRIKFEMRWLLFALHLCAIAPLAACLYSMYRMSGFSAIGFLAILFVGALIAIAVRLIRKRE